MSLAIATRKFHKEFLDIDSRGALRKFIRGRGLQKTTRRCGETHDWVDTYFLDDGYHSVTLVHKHDRINRKTFLKRNAAAVSVKSRTGEAEWNSLVFMEKTQ
ncbi:hypothetical protein C3942_17910 [Solimonas fluminis]|uniref:Uncharacterized protein n=1 Tax=Solimonas fluminis TaxID=2086571 RepID=A0A2S5TBV2_9GAMM|nr:hypothetical protein [Solimonas fluminis]PPE72422.1 hypothetical protein C3942_17910 [Solimonas fluminis]